MNITSINHPAIGPDSKINLKSIAPLAKINHTNSIITINLTFSQSLLRYAKNEPLPNASEAAPINLKY